MGDKKTRKPTLTTTTPTQDIAIDVLASGGTTADAAEAADVSRQTVSKWRNHHPGFQAALNLRRRDLNQERADRIRDLDAQALATVATAIDNGDIAAALAWVKSRRLHTVNVNAVGLIDAEAMMETKAKAIQERPEHQDPIYDLINDSQLSRRDALELAEAELVELFD